jgi:WD40 repeat protein
MEHREAIAMLNRHLLGLLAFLTLATAASAQQAGDDVRAVLAKFKSEREAAAKAFSPAEATVGDESAAKAESLLAALKYSQALQMATEARWMLPERSPDLPENVTRVLGASRLRHGDRINAVAYSPDSNYIVSSSKDGTARVWDVGNGREIVTYRGHEAEKFNDPETEKGMKKTDIVNQYRVPAVAISADSKTVATCGGKEVHVWELATGKQVAVLKDAKSEMYALAFHPTEANTLLSGGADKRFYLWDVKEKKVLHKSDEMSGTVFAVNFSPNGKWVIAADEFGNSVVFERGKWERPGYGGKTSADKEIRSIVFSTDNVNIFCGGKSKTANMIVGPAGTEAQVGSVVRGFTHTGDGVSSTLVAVAAAPDGKMLLTLSEADRLVIAWDIATGKKLRVYPGDPKLKKALCLAVRPDGKQIAVGYETGLIRLYTLVNNDEHRSFTQAKDNLWTTAFSPDGKLFATGGADRILRIYDTASGELKKELPGHKMAITSVVFLSNTSIATAGGDLVVKVWDINTGTAKDSSGHGLAILCLAATPDGKLLLSGAADRTVRGWDTETGKELWKVDTRSAACGVAVSANGKSIAVGTADGNLHLFQRGDGTPAKQFSTSAHTGGVACVAFHPEGNRVATGGGDGLVKMWSISEKGELAKVGNDFKPPFTLELGTTTPITVVGFSPDGKQVYGGGAEGVVRIWDATTTGEVRSLRGHTGWVTSAAYTPDGKSILSVAVDKAARFFDLPRSDSVPTGHLDSVSSVAVSRDGTRIATGGSDGLIKVWDKQSGKELLTLLMQPGTKKNEQENAVALVFLDNDRLVASGQTTTQTWNLTTGKLITRIEQKFTGIAMASTPDGSAFTVAWVMMNGNSDKNPNNGGFYTNTGKGEPQNIEVKPTPKAESINTATVSPDGVWGVLGRLDGAILIWDIAKREKVGADWALQKDPVLDVGVAGDRSILVTLSDKGEVRVADPNKREVKATFKAMKGDPFGIVMSPTGKHFVTMTGDGEIKAWDLTGKELRSWKQPSAPTCAVFSADGTQLMTGNTNGTVLVLDMPK